MSKPIRFYSAAAVSRWFLLARKKPPPPPPPDVKVAEVFTRDVPSTSKPSARPGEYRIEIRARVEASWRQ
jgi:hypothetical protein